MASLTTVNVTQNPQKRFSFKAAQDMMAYLNTRNEESQVVAASGTVAIASTGGKTAFFNGQPVQLAADAEMLIASSNPEPGTAWATATSYSVGDIRSASNGTRIRCISAHTSRSEATATAVLLGNEPFVSANWDTLWEEAPHGAVNAAGTSITAAYDQWFLVTATVDGTLQIWESGDEAATGAAECKVPQFDHKKYCPLAFIHIANGSASAFVVGTTSWATGSVTETYLQITNPIFPHEDNIDKN